MKAAQTNSEKKEGIYVGIQHFKGLGPVMHIERSDLKKLTHYVPVIGQLGREMGFSMKLEQIKRALGKEREYDK